MPQMVPVGLTQVRNFLVWSGSMKPMPDQIGSLTLQKSPGHLVLTYS